MTTMLITGATSGIGYALTQRAVKDGYQIIACGRNQGKLDELSRHSHITSLQFDVSDAEATATALKEASYDIAVLKTEWDATV